MRIAMVGVTNQTAPLPVRERLAVGLDRLPGLLSQLHDAHPNAEFMLLSTCNRTELYAAHASQQPPGPEALRDCLAAMFGLEAGALAPVMICRTQREAVRHLFRVASGLDSMVVGEPQVLGQVRRAYRAAVQTGTVGPALHLICQAALAAAKQTRAETGLGDRPASVATAAVGMALRVFESLSDKTVLSIGAGEMGKDLLTQVLARSPRRAWVTNRTPERATAIAARHRLRDPSGARPWADLSAMLAEADIVLTCTGAPQPVITPDVLRPALRKRRGRSLVLIDTAVPRDVDPAVASLSNVFVFDLDDLAATANQEAGDADRLLTAESLAADAADRCLNRLQHRDVGRLVRELRRRLLRVAEQEQDRTRRRLAAATRGYRPPDPDAIDALLAEHSHRLINKVLHLPLSRLDTDDPDAPLAFYAAALTRLFGLADDEPDAENVEPQPPARHNNGAEGEPLSERR